MLTVGNVSALENNNPSFCGNPWPSENGVKKFNWSVKPMRASLMVLALMVHTSETCALSRLTSPFWQFTGQIPWFKYVAGLSLLVSEAVNRLWRVISQSRRPKYLVKGLLLGTL